jgi:hypothetical protein
MARKEYILVKVISKKFIQILNRDAELFFDQFRHCYTLKKGLEICSFLHFMDISGGVIMQE